jgi:mannose-6-phosphate isomerase class I
MEELFEDYADPGAVKVAKSDSTVIDHPTLAKCQYFTGVATGTNKYLQAHADKDVTMSMVMILKHQACEVDEEVVVYFCFPRLGIAVPLRPGDILLFNALEPHALSSCRNIEDELVCMSLYHKAAVAGLNDNSMPLTKTKQGLAKKFQDNHT